MSPPDSKNRHYRPKLHTLASDYTIHPCFSHSTLALQYGSDNRESPIIVNIILFLTKERQQ
jgi:hypothetical protein